MENKHTLFVEKYPAIYYDGRSSMPQPGILELESHALRFTPDMIDFSESEHHFSVSDIHNIETASDDYIQLHFSIPNGAVIEVRDKQFFGAFKLHYPFSSAVKRNNFWVFSTPLQVTLLFGIVGCLMIGTIYFSMLSFLAAAAASRFPVSVEKKIGNLLADKIMTDFIIDTTRTKYFQKFADNLHYPGLFSMKPIVVKGEILNAFAIPGGQIVVYDSLLNVIADPSELAALLAHEYTHVEHRHTLRMLIGNVAGYALVSILFSDVSGITAMVLENAQSMKNLQYQRSMEQDADLTAVKYLQNRKLNPEGMVNLLEILKEQSPAASSISWFSTHPNIDKRIEAVKSSLNSEKTNYVVDDSLMVCWNWLKK